MLPTQLAKADTEEAHQTALFAYVRFAAIYGFSGADSWVETAHKPTARPVERPSYATALEWMHHIPNGGSRGDSRRSAAIVGNRLRAQGVKSGVADIFMPWYSAVWDKYGLYIEMKRPGLYRQGRTNGCTDAQIAFRAHCDSAGYQWRLCYSWGSAVAVIKNYLGWRNGML